MDSVTLMGRVSQAASTGAIGRIAVASGGEIAYSFLWYYQKEIHLKQEVRLVYLLNTQIIFNFIILVLVRTILHCFNVKKNL